jgi:hypothetical protein
MVTTQQLLFQLHQTHEADFHQVLDRVLSCEHKIELLKSKSGL